MSFGRNTYIDALLDEYVGPEQRGNQLLEDETNTLLYALLLETKALRARQTGDVEDARTIVDIVRDDLDGNAEIEGTYHGSTESFDESEWHEVDLGFTASEFDLRRITGGIEVAFADPAGDDNVIQYASSDSPVAGIPVRSSTVYLRSQTGEGSQSIRVEAWQ